MSSDNTSVGVPKSKRTKPIDTWLQLLGIAVGVLCFLFAKTPLAVMLCAVLIFALLIHPVWNFWWIDGYRGRQIFFTAILAGMCFLIGYIAWPETKNAPETDVTGHLIPANADGLLLPPNCEIVPPDAFHIFLGASMVWIQGNSPFRVIRVADDTLLSVETSPEGMVVNAKILGPDGRYIVEIERNKFRRNPNTSWYQDRPDKSTLVVYDDRKQEVLYVRYMNPSAVKIRGVFNYPNRLPIIVEERRFSPSSSIWVSEGCVGILGRDAAAINIR